MSLEQSIQNLADAINNLAKGHRFATIPMGECPSEAEQDVRDSVAAATAKAAELKAAEKAAKAEKAKSAAAEKTPEPVKAEELKAVEGELLRAGEKTEAEIREEAFGAPNGYIYAPFIALGQGGKNVAAQKAICAQFGVQRISLVPVDQIPALKAAVEAALAEVQG